ncbi:hypothetical protein RvVAR0630_13380 [Agrobacterium vitis]|uniref:ORC-CDC6 family AAA ATPase n=1 Tax=Agrobacterium vitis TaxID=373 RepID=UPI0015D6F343|nr:hypothetical protein [Agrobacterium vitis]BCH58714.1 hypothetical protein RvVAR0630_13380 [Agrobacterium vitis]
MSTNPFGVQNPEHVDAAYIARNFVEVQTDFPRLKEHGNTFIHGARGTGKSMLLRSLEPRVMILQEKADKLKDLPFVAVHVPLRTADFGAPEFNRYKGYAVHAIGEHLLAMHVVLRVTQLLDSFHNEISQASAERFRERFEELFSVAGGSVAEDASSEPLQGETPFQRVANTCEKNIFEVRQFLVRQWFRNSEPDYVGALAGFLDFLVPLSREVKRLDGVPSVPLFVMLDDADNLPIPLQRVLNSWVSTRSTGDICLKVTTQLAYATMRTLDNRIIESPHDYAEVNLTAVYTASSDIYSRRLHEIVTKRLQNSGILSTVDQFFPLDKAQDERLRVIAAEITAEHIEMNLSSEVPVGSARSRDEVRRYTVPQFMREIAGSSKSAHTYSYAGFRSLVDLSSGVVRWFLEPASRMYDRMISEGLGDGTVTEIPVSVQDAVIKDWSAEFLEPLTRQTTEISDALTDLSEGIESLHADGHETILYEQLGNLIEGLGRLFRGKLLDQNASEQRVFSVVLRDRPKPELERVLNLGVRLGYLQRSDYAAKEALGGRRPRYILARRLGPHYKLDISGYAAHLSIMSKDLELAMRSPGDFVKTRLKQDGSADSQFSLDLDGARF